MARGEQITRHWNLLKFLQTRGGGVTLKMLVDEFEVSERTIQRDFEVLQEVGFPVEFETDEYGKRFWSMPHDFFRTGPLVLSLTEAVSLHLAEHLFAPLAGTLFADGLAGVLAKIRSLLPRAALDYFRDLSDTVFVRRIGLTDYSAHAETIERLTAAARETRSVEVTYRSLWRTDEYATRFDPYGLVFYEGDLFAVGRSHRADAVRVFKINRIRTVQPTDSAFRRPSDFRIEEHFRHSFGIVRGGGPPLEVVVRFTGPVAALVEERIWHESQKLEWLPAETTLFERPTEEAKETEGSSDGQRPQPNEPQVLRATFRLSDTVEFKKWIKGFGEHAEVLRPESLRRELGEELLAAGRLYQD